MYDIGISTFFLISSSPVIKWIQFLLCIRDLTSYETKPAMRERTTHPVIYTNANSGDVIRRAHVKTMKMEGKGSYFLFLYALTETRNPGPFAIIALTFEGVSTIFTVAMFFRYHRFVHLLSPLTVTSKFGQNFLSKLHIFSLKRTFFGNLPISISSKQLGVLKYLARQQHATQRWTKSICFKSVFIDWWQGVFPSLELSRTF